MRKEAAHGKLASRRNAIECARGPHATRSAARQEASPQIMRRFIRIAAVPQTAKHARRIAGGPQAHHRFRRAHQAANRRHASEAKTIGYHGASRGPTPWWWFPLCTRTFKRCRCPACTARISSSKRRHGCNGLEEPLSLIEQGFIDTSCLISKRYTLNDILEAYRAFEAREDGCLKVVITPLGRTLTSHSRKDARRDTTKSLGRLFKGIDQLAKGERSNQSATKAKNRVHQCYGPTNS